MFLASAVLLTAARVLGELARWLRQPAVLGEILAGLLLGPTVLGRLAPDWQAELFPRAGPNAVALAGLSNLSIALFLLVAGMEVDLSTAWRQGAKALKVATTGMLVPFAVGLAMASFLPAAVGMGTEADATIFTLFFATALAISALPVIAKTLMDLNLYRTDLGVLIVSAAMINDLIGWFVFAVVLGMMRGQTSFGGSPILSTIGLTLGFAVTMLTAVRWLVNRALPWIQAYTHWPGGVLSFSLGLALFAAAMTEWIGIHAIFGAFLMGAAIGDSPHLRQMTRTTIEHFAAFFFAPLFFAGIGLRVDFAAHFDWRVASVVFAVACFGKLVGCWLGGRWARMHQQEIAAVAFAMNARGAMEIILGLLALEARVIDERLFVALVVMALATTMLAGPAVQLALRWRKPLPLSRMFSAKCFVRPLRARTASQAIEELVAAASSVAHLDPLAVVASAAMREQTMSTGIGHRVAIPLARVAGLNAALVVVGMSDHGVDFDAPDGQLAQLLFLVLTPLEDDGAQADIMAQLSRIAADSRNVDRALQAASFTEFIALLNSLSSDAAHARAAR